MNTNDVVNTVLCVIVLEVMTDPTKQDISLVFKRLRSNGPNKVG